MGTLCPRNLLRAFHLNHVPSLHGNQPAKLYTFIASLPMHRPDAPTLHGTMRFMARKPRWDIHCVDTHRLDASGLFETVLPISSREPAQHTGTFCPLVYGNPPGTFHLIHVHYGSLSSPRETVVPLAPRNAAWDTPQLHCFTELS